MNVLRKINYRVLLISLIIIVQLVWGVTFLLRILDYSEWISSALSLFSIVVVLFLNMKEENASYKIGWIILGSLTLYPIRICSKALQQAYFFVKFSK